MIEHPTIGLLQEKFGAAHLDVREFRGQVTVVVAKSILLEVVGFLKNECGYNQLTDVLGADYLGYPKEEARFGLIYPFLNVEENRRIVVKIFLSEDDLVVPTLTGLYRGANWPEREAAEMFGFVFEGHPDPRRILLCDLFEGKHPLRKTYPLRGEGERESFTPVTTESA
jgi:NADH-quinone oxidoreductase subunit C